MDIVNIIYEQDSVVGFLILSELLRLFGIYVREMYVSELTDRTFETADMVIILHAPMRQNLWDASMYPSVQYVCVKDFDGTLTWRQWFLRVWRKIGVAFVNRGMIQTPLETLLIGNLSTTVIGTGAIQACYDMRFLYGQEQNVKRSMMMILQDTLQTACDQVKNHPAPSLYGQYFIINLKRKINRLYQLSDYILPYKNETLMQEADELLQRYPSFKQIFTLKGLIADGDKIMSGYADIYYKGTADKADETLVWNDYVAYRLGRFYEKVRENDEMAAHYYEIAYQNEDNYRALYKVAFFAERREDYETAYELYGRLIKRLEDVLDAGMIQPIQTEYLFKVYYRMIRIDRIRFKQYYRGQSLANRAINLVKIAPNSSFFQAFYGNLANEKAAYMQKFLSLDAVQREKCALDMEIGYFEGTIS